MNRNRHIYDIEDLNYILDTNKIVSISPETEQIDIHRPDCGTYQTLNKRNLGPRFNGMQLLTLDSMTYPSIVTARQHNTLSTSNNGQIIVED